jgi:hypothetical protein
MEGVIATIFFFTSIVLIWGGIIFTRHKERMTIVERGLKPEDMKALYERGSFQLSFGSSLKWGIVLVGIGLAVLVGMWLRQAYDVEGGVFPGLIALFGGLGLVVYYMIAGKKSGN